MPVDQSTNFGRWNSLGVYYLTIGQSGRIAFDNNADGPILADAIKFVYHGKCCYLAHQAVIISKWRTWQFASAAGLVTVLFLCG